MYPHKTYVYIHPNFLLENTKRVFVSALKKIDFMLKESRDLFRDFRKNLKLFVFVNYPKKVIFKKNDF